MSQYPFSAKTAFVDSAATDHYTQPSAPLLNKQTLHNAKPIYLTNGDTIKANQSGVLPNLPMLDTTTKTAQICQHINNISLISLGKLCDGGCEAKLNSKMCTVYKDERPIIKAPRCKATGMYVMDVTKPLPNVKLKQRAEMANSSLAQKQAKVANIQNFISLERLKFYHSSLGATPLRTLKQAVCAGYLKSWAGLTPQSIKKLTEPDYTYFGHLDHVRKNIQSTQDDEWKHTLESPIVNKSNTFYHKIINFNDTISTDQTGKFSCMSSKQMNYILVTYSYDTNAILARPLKSKSSTELTTVIVKIHQYLTKRGYKPKHHWLDNEVSTKLLDTLQDMNVTVHLVPPYCHRKLAAERAIRTYKNHFITILCMTHPEFPMKLWCSLIPQSEMTLNMVRPCRFNPLMSAHTALEGEFQYADTPLAPLGSLAIAGTTPSQRASWAPHGTRAWVIGPAMNHYRCISLYVPKTNGHITADTFRWSDTNLFRLPKITVEEQITTAALSLAEAIRKNSTFCLPNTTLREDVHKLASIFQQGADAILKSKLTVKENTPASPRVNQTDNATVETRTNSPTSPRVSESTSLPTLSPYASSTQKELRMNQERPSHRHPTRSKKQLANTTVQLEQKQMKEHLPATFNFSDINTANPPNQLKYNKLIQGTDKGKWLQGMSNELGRLTQGFGPVKGNNTFFFTPKKQMPNNKTATYIRTVCAIRPHKTETHRVRITAGGNRVFYAGEKSTPIASIETIKMHWNSVISTKNAKYMTIDLKDFYLKLKLLEYEYIKIKLSTIPPEFAQKYNLHDIVDSSGYVHAEVRGGMHGFSQVGRLAYEDLKAHLAKYGCNPVKFTPGLWKHQSNNVSFTLVVDDFGVKYTNIESLNHLINALKSKYEITTNITGNLYIGVTLKWNYTDSEVNCSMPGYLPRLLQRLLHVKPKSNQDSPFPAPHIKYGEKTQYAFEEEDLPILEKEGITIIQSIVGASLYFGRIIDNTILVAVNDIGSQQAKPTEKTLSLTTWLLDYMATHPNPSITYKKSDMQYWISSDSSYLSASKARSRVGGHHFLGNIPRFDLPLVNQRTFINAPFYVEASILKSVVGAASEAEVAAAYVNARHGITHRITLLELDHPQHQTPLEIDNTTAYGILTNTLIPKRSKAIDMRFFWLRDRENQKQFKLYWAKGINNLADYFTKHHPTEHHRNMRRVYLANMIQASQQPLSATRGVLLQRGL